MVTNLDLAACFSCSREVGPRAFGIGGKKWRFLKNESKDIYLLKCRQEDEESGSKSGKVRQYSNKRVWLRWIEILCNTQKVLYNCNFFFFLLQLLKFFTFNLNYSIDIACNTNYIGYQSDSWVIEYSLDFFFFFFLGPIYSWTLKCEWAMISIRHVLLSCIALLNDEIPIPKP